MLKPVIAADDCSIITSPEPLNTARCQFTPFMARSTKYNLSGMGGYGTEKPAQFRRSSTKALHPLNK